MKIRANVECGGCGQDIPIDLDSAESTGEKDLFDYVIDGLRGVVIGPSVQSDIPLCATCTSKVDDAITEDRDATEHEINEICGA